MRPILDRRPFLQITVTNFFFFCGLNGFVLLPLYIQELGGTEVEIGVVMGVYNAIGIVCQPLVGPWVDAFGRRLFIRVGLVLVLTSTLIATVAGAIPWLALVRALQGVGFSLFFVAAFAHALDLVPRARRGWALGMYGVSGLAATAVAPLIGEGVVRWLGFRALFVGCAAFILVSVGLAWGMRERRRGSRDVAPSLTLRIRVDELRHVHMAVTLFFGLSSGTVFAFLPTFAESLGVRTLALFYTAYAGSAMAVRIFAGGLSDTHGRRAVIVPSMYVQAGASACLALVGLLVTRTSSVPVLPVLFLAGLLAGGSHGTLYPSLAALVADQTPTGQRATAIGLFSAVFLFGSASGAVVFGFVSHGLGYGPMWSILGGLLLLGAALSMRLPEVAPRSAG